MPSPAKPPETRILRKGPTPPGANLAQALDASADPMADPVNKEKVEIAKEFAFHLAKGIKNIGIYRHNTGRFGEYLQRALDALAKYGEEFGPLSLKVEAECFSLFKQPLFQAESAHDNLPFKFYRDGIRQLIFRPEISLEELVEFVMIALSDPQRGGEDILAQLWKASLEHLEYVVVEGFGFGELSEEQVQVQVDQVVNYLYTRLRSHSNDFLRFARLRAEDLDAKLEGVDQIRGAVVTGVTANDAYKEKVQELLRADETKLFGKVVQTVFSTLDSGTLGDFELLKDLFAQILDALLLQEDYVSVVEILRKLKALAQESSQAAVAAPLADYWTSKMGEEQRLRQLGETLKRVKVKDAEYLRDYLLALDSRATVPLLEVLDTLEMAANRQIIVDALVELGKDYPEPFVNRLTSEKSQMVRDMISVIERCDFKDKVKYFGKALENRNPAVRLEVISMLAKSRSEQARRFVASAMEDASAQVAIHAAKALARNAPERALTELVRIVKAPEFEKRELKEREGFYAALGLTQLPGAFSLFTDILKQKTLVLGRRKLTEQKICACAGLGGIPSVHAYKALQAIHEDKGNDDELLTAARKALFQVRKALEAAKTPLPKEE
jgi:hypothetical protein